MKYLIGFLFLVSLLSAQTFWKNVNSAGQSANLWGVSTSPEQILAVGTSGTILSSSDGMFWSGSSSGTSNWLLGVVNGNGTWVAVGELGTILYADATLKWTSASYTPTGNSQRLNGVAWGAGHFVAVGEGGVIFTSLDGKVWTAQSSGVSTALRGISYGRTNSLTCFLATGANGVVLYSLDSVTWIRVITPTTAFLEAVAFGNNSVAIVGQNGVILQSPVVGSWTLRTSTTTSWLRGVAFDGLGQFVATSELGTVVVSADGINWTRQPTGTITAPITNNLFAGTYSSNLNHFIAVGDGGTILTSGDQSVMTNVATRGFVGTDSNVLIAGFVISGSTPKRVMVRAIGPSLQIFGLNDLLAQPVLTLFDSKNIVVAQNKGWSVNNATATPAQIAIATSITGAFPIAATTADSILLKTLSPGAYTAQVSGAGSTTGTALVEVYQLP